MIQEHVIDFARGNLFAAAIDNLFDAARDEKIPIGIQNPLVTRPEPTMGERAVVGRRIVLVALGDVRATDDDLALLPRGLHVAGFVHNRNVWTRRHAHRTHNALPGWEWIASHLMRGLCHAVGLDHRYLERFF
jgi:hypothetical protein